MNAKLWELWGLYVIEYYLATKRRSKCDFGDSLGQNLVEVTGLSGISPEVKDNC